jgi:SAM-dependent methyltransferase
MAPPTKPLPPVTKTSMPNSVEYYAQNSEYTQLLEGLDPILFDKYIDTLARHAERDGRALDVGCGVGQVVGRLTEAGVRATGVDVSVPSVAACTARGLDAVLYEGRRLPFDDATFAVAGAMNVLEHVDDPQGFVGELVRVVRPGGHVVLSSPNFFRVIGLRDYHPHMRGLLNKAYNAARLARKAWERAFDPDELTFDRMAPVVRPAGAIQESDDDAIMATNALEMQHALERAGCVIESFSCADRYVRGPLGWILDLPLPHRYLMLNAFVVARRR